MSLFAEASGWSIVLNIVVMVVSVVLMIAILIQRGKGGGLAGAFGGPGGSSAFGSRAGDAFTRITLWIALIWVLLIMVHVKTAGCDRAATNTNFPGGVESR